MIAEPEQSNENNNDKRQARLVFGFVAFVSFWIGTMIAGTCADQRAFAHAVRDGLIVGTIASAVLSLLFASHQIKAPHYVTLAILLILFMPFYWIFWVALIGV